MLQRFPELKARLESGKLNPTLVEIAQGCAHREKLSDPEIWELLESISGMSCQGARREIARRYPQSVAVPYDRIRPLTEELSEVRFVVNQALLDKLEEIRGLLAHSHPGATFAELIDVLATEYRERHHPEEKAKRAEARQQKKKETESVKTPTAARVQFVQKRTASGPQKHALIRRDGYRCAYTDPVTGQRCTSQFALEIDHCQEWVFGGKTELANLRFLCRNHHRRVSFKTFGEWGALPDPLQG